MHRGVHIKFQHLGSGGGYPEGAVESGSAKSPRHTLKRGQAYFGSDIKGNDKPFHSLLPGNVQLFPKRENSREDTYLIGSVRISIIFKLGGVGSVAIGHGGPFR